MVEERTHQLKETLSKLERSKEELGRSLSKEKELNELKSRFVSLASHEFRTPLSTILSSTYLLQKYTTSEEQLKRQKHIERIISSVNTLTDILNDFLSVGKIEEGKISVKKSAFNLRTLVSRIIDEVKSIKRTGQNIAYTHSGAEEIFLDASLLKHIVLNLVSNAMKFSPENSQIEIRSAIQGNEMELSVTDQGIGICKGDEEHLFERFYGGSNAGNIQGTGLGLHIVAKYAEMMNGNIVCHSEADEGTKMIVRFEAESIGSENGNN